MIRDTLFFEKGERLFFTADHHWHHERIIKYCQRPFSNVEEMDEKLITNWNNVVGDDDIVFHLGDFAKGGSSEWSRLLQRLKGKIYLILGNHDLKTIGASFSRLEDVAMQMIINVEGQRIYLNHSPSYVTAELTGTPGNCLLTFILVTQKQEKTFQDYQCYFRRNTTLELTTTTSQLSRTGR